MEEVAVTKTDLARRTREVLDRAQKPDVRVVVTRYGQPEVAIVNIDEYRALVDAQERLRQLERDEALIRQLMERSGIGREEAQLKVAEARKSVYTLVEEAHERNPNLPSDVVDALVEEAREAMQGRQ